MNASGYLYGGGSCDVKQRILQPFTAPKSFVEQLASRKVTSMLSPTSVFFSSLILACQPQSIYPLRPWYLSQDQDYLTCFLMSIFHHSNSGRFRRQNAFLIPLEVFSKCQLLSHRFLSGCCDHHSILE